jgi:hypothetical protein
MHTFRKSQSESLWTVGYYRPSSPNHEWMPIEDFTDEKSAAAYTNYLNGGNAFVEVVIIEP